MRISHQPCMILLTCLWFLMIPASGQEQPVPDAVTATVTPLLAKYCTSCHDASDPQASLDLSIYTDELSVLKDRKRWDNIQRMVRASEMPPKDQPQPTLEEKDELLRVVGDVLNRVDCGKPGDPGRVTIRRLNRVEYNNTVRDLTGVDIQPADDFPADDIGYGFDHIADVLFLPPVLFEKYFAAAERIADKALREGEITNGPIRRYLSREMKWTGPGDAPEKGKYARHIILGGELQTEIETAVDAEYIANVRGLVFPKCKKPFQLELRIDGAPVKVLDFTEMRTKTYPVRITIPAGKRTISVALITEGGDPEELPPDRKEEAIKNGDDPNLARFLFEYIDMQGPIDDSPTLSEQLILVSQPKSDGSDEITVVEQILTSFVRRAFRRPVTAEDVSPYVELFRQRRTDGDSYIRSLKVVLSAILISPQFLFRIEDDGAGSQLANQNNAAGQTDTANTSAVPESENTPVVRDLTDFELATRLSYFLWSTMPDDELFTAASTGQLRHPDVLMQQVRRMLTDPRRNMLVENFAGQWLQLRNLNILKPDPGIYPQFDDSLRTSMKRETEAFFEYLIHEDRSVLELLDADYTFANERLAKHYGLEGITGDTLQKVSLPADQRGGVLTQGSILTVTSNPTRTSPVKRGKWILENILGTPPPPPPPMVDPLDESSAAASTGSLRERMVLHRSKPGCASCHERMDPLGFGLENFDGVGGWRTADAGFPIDAAGDLPTGESFKTPRELRGILMQHRDEFARCLAEKMLTYALGRGLEYYDKCALDKIVDTLKQNDYRFSALIDGVVTSEPFQRRRIVRIAD
jgi:hypothetical protein